MRARNGAGATHHIDDADARGFEQLGGQLDLLSATESVRLQAGNICAELFGDDTCTALGFTARGHSPVIALCGQLIEAGFDPGRPLHAYRNGTLALRVGSIGQAARLTVKTAGNGAPMFALDSGCRGAGGPPIAPSEQTGVRVAIAGTAP